MHTEIETLSARAHRLIIMRILLQARSTVSVSRRKMCPIACFLENVL